MKEILPNEASFWFWMFSMAVCLGIGYTAGKFPT